MTPKFASDAQALWCQVTTMKSQTWCLHHYQLQIKMQLCWAQLKACDACWWQTFWAQAIILQINLHRYTTENMTTPTDIYVNKRFYIRFNWITLHKLVQLNTKILKAMWRQIWKDVYIYVISVVCTVVNSTSQIFRNFSKSVKLFLVNASKYSVNRNDSSHPFNVVWTTNSTNCTHIKHTNTHNNTQLTCKQWTTSSNNTNFTITSTSVAATDWLEQFPLLQSNILVSNKDLHKRHYINLFVIQEDTLKLRAI